MTVVLLIVCLLAWMSRWAARRIPSAAAAGEAGAAVTALLGWLFGLALVALIDNPFGAVTFLIFPSLLWIWIGPARLPYRRAVNALLVAAGFLALIALVVSYGQRLRIGPYIVWYLFMGVAYGQISVLRVVMTLVMVAIGVRLLSQTVFRAA